MKYAIIILALTALLSSGVSTCDATRSSVSSGDPFVMIGARLLAENGFVKLHARRVGLITNHTSMVGKHHLVDIMHQSPNICGEADGGGCASDACFFPSGTRQPQIGALRDSAYAQNIGHTETIPHDRGRILTGGDHGSVERGCGQVY